MTYCPACKKWRDNLTTTHSVDVVGADGVTHARFIKRCRKCGTEFVPNGKKSTVHSHGTP